MRHVHVARHVVLTAIMGLVPCVAAVAQSASSPVFPTIATSGQGEAKVTPDRASISVNVQTRASTAAIAGADNARRTLAVLDALGKLGLTREQLTTESYSVYPELKYDNSAAGSSPKVVSYVVTNTVRAETRHPDQAGPIVDAALASGANLINSLSFYASSIDDPRRQAISSAVLSARLDAEAMARAAGGALGELLELSTGGPTVPPRPMFELAMRGKSADAAGSSSQINPGQQTVNVFVTARWRFLPNK